MFGILSNFTICDNTVLSLCGLLGRCAGGLVLIIGVSDKLHGRGECEAGGWVRSGGGAGGHTWTWGLSSGRGSQAHSLEQLTNTWGKGVRYLL